MDFIVVLKNEKRTVVKIKKGNLYSYAWIQNNELTMNRTNFQEEDTILNPTKEELQEMFKGIKITTDIQISFDSDKCRVIKEKCTMII